jgi:hypothetical protein
VKEGSAARAAATTEAELSKSRAGVRSAMSLLLEASVKVPARGTKEGSAASDTSTPALTICTCPASHAVRASVVCVREACGVATSASTSPISLVKVMAYSAACGEAVSTRVTSAPAMVGTASSRCCSSMAVMKSEMTPVAPGKGTTPEGS